MKNWFSAEDLSNILIIALSSVLLWHFFNIWYYEKFFIQEPNIYVRSAETVMLLGILSFGIVRFAHDLRNKD